MPKKRTTQRQKKARRLVALVIRKRLKKFATVKDRAAGRTMGEGDWKRPDSIDDFLYAGLWMPVVSSNVDSVRYAYDDQILSVRFRARGGGQRSEYEYEDVPPRIARDFVLAESPGRYVWRRLRDRYPYRRVR